MKFYYDDDANINLLKEKTIGIIGFGNQGRAHALNLRDSGINVIVGLRPGSKSQKMVEDENIKTETIEKTAEIADIIYLLIPDELQAEVYKSSIEPHLQPGNVLGFAHGFNLQYGGINPPDFVDTIINSPKCIGISKFNPPTSHAISTSFGFMVTEPGTSAISSSA